MMTAPRFIPASRPFAREDCTLDSMLSSHRLQESPDSSSRVRSLQPRVPGEGKQGSALRRGIEVILPRGRESVDVFLRDFA